MDAIVIGAGGSGFLHSLALRAAGVRVSAIYDPDVDRARLLADHCRARVALTLDEAAATSASIAAICSPPNVHVAQAEAIASPGRTIFVEKPVAVERGELERLAALDGCVPILQWRAGRALRALRRAIAHGYLGSSPSVSIDLAWARDDAYLAARRDWGCGAVLSVGIHALDAVAWALDRSIEGVAGISSSERMFTAETAAVGALRLAGGSAIAFRVSFDGGADLTCITICGGGVTGRLVGDEADPTAGAFRWSARDASLRSRLEELERATPGARGAPLLVPYLGAALAAVRDGERPGDSERLPSIADAFAAHAAAMAMVRQFQ